MVTSARERSGSVLLVGRLEAGKLQTLAHPFGELVEVERLVEDDARPAILVPAHLALDRPQALDHHDDLLADAIFLDRLDFHAGQRNIVHVHAVIELAHTDGGLARDLQPWRTRTETVARLATGKKLAKIEILVELQTDQIIADPHDRGRDLLRRKLDIDMTADLGRGARYGHQPAGRQVLDLDQLLLARSVGELGDAQHGRNALVGSAL